MQRRDNLTHLILVSVVILVLTSLMVDVEVQAQIAFESDRDWDALQFEIYVMDTDGGNQRNLTNNPNEDRYKAGNRPSWSPDGKRIVFSSRRDGHFRGNFGITHEIYVMDADGENQQRLTENRQYDWSPDGKRIAFVSNRGLLTVHRLLSCLIGGETLKTLKST